MINEVFEINLQTIIGNKLQFSIETITTFSIIADSTVGTYFQLSVTITTHRSRSG